MVRSSIIVLLFMPVVHAACHAQPLSSPRQIATGLAAAPPTAAFAASRGVQTTLGLSRSQRCTCSLSLRASDDEDMHAKKQEVSPKTWRAVRHRRQGRVLGRFLYTRLEKELQEASEFGKNLAENVFDSSVNVVDVSLAKFAKDAAMAADRSLLHGLGGIAPRAAFITGKGQHVAQAAWQAAEQVLMPLKSVIVHLGGLHPAAVAVGSMFASLHSLTSAWLTVFPH